MSAPPPPPRRKTKLPSVNSPANSTREDKRVVGSMAGNGINAARQMNGKLPPVQQKVTSDINSVDFEPESVIGEGVDIRGTLEFERLLRIDGRFEGILRSKGDLIIGAKGQLVGDVNGIQNLVIDGGSIKGSVVVERMVMIGKATIRGNITCKSLKAGIDATIIGMVNINPSAPEMIGLNGEVLSVLPELADDSEEVEMERAKDREIELLRQLEEQENGDHDVHDGDNSNLSQSKEMILQQAVLPEEEVDSAINGLSFAKQISISSPVKKAVSSADLETDDMPVKVWDGSSSSSSAALQKKISTDEYRMTYSIGDVVRVDTKDKKFEGVVADIGCGADGDTLTVFHREKLIKVPVAYCLRIAKATDFEVGDKVEVRPKGMAIFFVGYVKAVYPNGTVDVRMDGDDPEDIERGVPIGDSIRKLVPKKLVVVNRWRKAIHSVRAIVRMKKFSADHNLPGNLHNAHSINKNAVNPQAGSDTTLSHGTTEGNGVTSSSSSSSSKPSDPSASSVGAEEVVYRIGDVVRVKEGFQNRDIEAVVVDLHAKASMLTVFYRERTIRVAIAKCERISKATDYEIGDKVEARPNGSALFFVGRIIAVHENATIDVRMDGDDENDIERGIPLGDSVRKLIPRRLIVAERWRKAFHSVQAIARMRRLASRDNGGDMIIENGIDIAPSAPAVCPTDDISSASPMNDATPIPAGAVTDSAVSGDNVNIGSYTTSQEHSGQ